MPPAVTRLVWGCCSDPSLQKHLRIFICCDTQLMYFNVAGYSDNFLSAFSGGRKRKTLKTLTISGTVILMRSLENKNNL